MGKQAIKKCCRCGIYKTYAEFTTDKRAKTGRVGACRVCEKIRSDRWRLAHPEKLKAYHKSFRKKASARVNKIKLESGCSVCGFNSHPAALEFHHLDAREKEFNIGNIRRGNLEKILKEIKKCVILCSNCHRILHAKEKEDKI